MIGSPTSSNAQRLVEVAQARGAEATLIDGESELDDELLDGHEIVGLTAGASTPEELVQAVARAARRRGYDELEEVTVAREDVHFRLPREVVGAVTTRRDPRSVAAALPTLSVFDITNDVSREVRRRGARRASPTSPPDADRRCPRHRARVGLLPRLRGAARRGSCRSTSASASG